MPPVADPMAGLWRCSGLGFLLPRFCCPEVFNVLKIKPVESESWKATEVLMAGTVHQIHTVTELHNISRGTYGKRRMAVELEAATGGDHIHFSSQ